MYARVRARVTLGCGTRTHVPTVACIDARAGEHTHADTLTSAHTHTHTHMFMGRPTPDDSWHVPKHTQMRAPTHPHAHTLRPR